MNDRSRTASDLRALAHQILAIAELAASDLPAIEADSSISDMALAGEAARLLAVSRSRRVLVACDMSGGDYWDIMLALFIARVTGSSPTHPDAPFGPDWSKPATWRWIGILRERGLVMPVGDPTGSELVPVHLTVSGSQLVSDILSHYRCKLG